MLNLNQRLREENFQVMRENTSSFNLKGKAGFKRHLEFRRVGDWWFCEGKHQAVVDPISSTEVPTLRYISIFLMVAQPGHAHCD